METAVQVRELVALLESGERRNEDLSRAAEFAKQRGSHGRLCTAMVKGWRKGDEAGECRLLLHALGSGPALTAVHANISTAQLAAAEWLSGEVCYLLSRHQLSQLLFSQCLLPTTPSHPHHLTPSQESLVGVLCRLPDLLANRLGRDLPSSLLPLHYFTAIAHGLMECLRLVYSAVKCSRDCSLGFPAAVAGKAALLGHTDALLSFLVPELEKVVLTDCLWQRLTQTFFARVPPSGVESVMDGLLTYCTPSLKPPTPLYCMLGDLPVTSHRAHLVFTHKLFLVRVPSSHHALFTLAGYLSSSSPLRDLMGKSLQSALEVWSDVSALRHMSSRQHVWISSLLTLCTTCLSDSELNPRKPILQRLLMAGVEVHISSPQEELRHIGMAIGETLMNRLHPSLPGHHQLKFEFEPNQEVQALLHLARSLDEQEGELRLSAPPPKSPPPDPATHPTASERFGEGLVQTTSTDTDSDDDLEPYAMGSDPDSSRPPAPRYLRTLLQALLSTSDPLCHETALQTAEQLILSKPPDLTEVCVELMTVLLHLSDTLALPEFSDLRLRSMTSLAITCPAPSAQYLTDQFYSPNYSIRQRMDILEVLSSAAVQLATPTPEATPSPSNIKGRRSQHPWEDIVKERIKLKTRVFLKGQQSPASPNRFAPVAGLFFFPLMAGYDHPLNTLVLLGQDWQVLSQLLHSLGTMMHCACNAPIAPAMAAALLDFLWALRYHHSQYVRQGVLYALSMVVVATPPTLLAEDIEGTLVETVHWLKDVCENDADGHCRSLAQHTLTLLNGTLSQAQR